MGEEELKIKIALCGEGGVGKTSLATVFVGEGFNPKMRLTVGVQHFFKDAQSGGRRIRVTIWDLGGEHRFRFLAPTFLRGAKGLVFVFDVTREDTFLSLPKWLEIAKSVVGDVPRLLVGNKVDLQDLRVVPKETAEDYARREGFIGYVEASARLNFNVKEIFTLIVKEIVKGDLVWLE